MSTKAVSPESLALRALLESHRPALDELLEKYGASRPMVFGSLARGAAHTGSDIDILVDMDPADGNLLMRASGLLEEVRELFGNQDVDILPRQLVRGEVSSSALADAVAL